METEFRISTRRTLRPRQGVEKTGGGFEVEKGVSEEEEDDWRMNCYHDEIKNIFRKTLQKRPKHFDCFRGNSTEHETRTHQQNFQ